MKKTMLLLLALTVFPVYGFCQQTANRLFIIERSKNANIVCYDVNLDSDGKINEKTPVVAYWLLYAKKGEQENLSVFDKKAYGFKAKYNEQNKNYDFTLKAVDDKPMFIDIYDTSAKVVININGKKCFLEKVYIESKDGAFGIPKVFFYVLYGQDIETGNKQEEKINVK